MTEWLTLLPPNYSSLKVHVALPPPWTRLNSQSGKAGFDSPPHAPQAPVKQNCMEPSRLSPG